MNSSLKKVNFWESSIRTCKIIMKHETFYRTESGKSWKTKPETVEVKEIEFMNYRNIIDAIPFFRGLGGSESVQNGYTKAGYIPFKVTSISPDRESKVVRTFQFN